MESQDLRVFLEVAKLGSISKAAQTLGYVQPNVTGRIKKLEDELGCLLFERHSRGVTLTRDGEQLEQEGRKIIHRLDALTGQFHSSEAQPKTFVIGTTQSIAGYLLPEVIINLRNTYKRTEIHVMTDHQERMQERLDSGDMDLLITNRPVKYERAECIGNYREELMLIGPSECTDVASMVTHPIVVNRLKSCPYRQTLTQWIKEEVSSLIEVDTLEAMIQTVALGGGIALLPRGAVAHREDIAKVYIDDLQRTALSIWMSKDKEVTEQKKRMIKVCLDKIEKILGEEHPFQP